MIFILVFIPFIAKSTVIEDLQARDPSACKDIDISENYYAFMECVGGLADNSDKKMQQRLSEIRADLKKLDEADLTAAFEVSQKDWQKYKESFCEYITAGIDKKSNAYWSQLRLCEAQENYRRLDALIGEPSVS